MAITSNVAERKSGNTLQASGHSGVEPLSNGLAQALETVRKTDPRKTWKRVK